MALIIGFDPSKYTGWSLFDTDKHESQIKCGVFELPEKCDPYFTGDQIAAKVRTFINDIRQKYGRNPDFAVLEEQKLNAFGKKGFNGIIYPWIGTTAVVSIISQFGIPYATLTDSQWREIYGKDFQPPQVPVMEGGKQVLDKHGKPKFSDDWKAAAVNECLRLEIEIPRLKAIAHNACEAAVLVRKWDHKAMKFHARRYQEPWMKLVQARGEKARAA